MQTFQENPLVLFFDGNPVTTTFILAEGTDNQHKNVISMVKKYENDLAEFGQVTFQTRLNTQGSPTEYAILNEPQAALLMTYMSNTPIIRDFKKRLIAAFFSLRSQSFHNSIIRMDIPEELGQACAFYSYLRKQKAYHADILKIIRETEKNCLIRISCTSPPLAVEPDPQGELLLTVIPVVENATMEVEA